MQCELDCVTVSMTCSTAAKAQAKRDHYAARGLHHTPFASFTIYQTVDAISCNATLCKDLVSHLLVNGLKSSKRIALDLKRQRKA